jgi:hypothetical protein
MYIYICIYTYYIYIIHLFPVERLALNLYFIPLRAALVSTPGIFLPSAFRPRGLDVLNASTLQMRSLTGLVALRFHQLQLGFHLIAVEIWDQSRKKWTWICQKASWILSGYPRYPQVLVIKYTGFWGYGSLFSEEPDWWMRESPWWPHGRHHHKLCLACEELPHTETSTKVCTNPCSRGMYPHELWRINSAIQQRFSWWSGGEPGRYCIHGLLSEHHLLERRSSLGTLAWKGLKGPKGAGVVCVGGRHLITCCDAFAYAGFVDVT